MRKLSLLVLILFGLMLACNLPGSTAPPSASQLPWAKRWASYK